MNTCFNLDKCISLRMYLKATGHKLKHYVAPIMVMPTHVNIALIRNYTIWSKILIVEDFDNFDE